jgi:opacity protein-like surface antigen
MRVHSALTVLSAVACLSAPLVAQSAQRWSIQASGLGVGVFGEAYDGLKTGYGFEAQLRSTPSLWSFGGGVQSSQHGLKEVAGTNVTLLGVFFEPRRVFDVGSAKFAPYFSGRLSYLRQSADLDVALGRTARVDPQEVSLSVGRRAALTISASGFQGNVGGGVLARLSPRVNLDLGATVGLIKFGDAKAEIDGAPSGTFDGTSGTGQNLLLRVGLAIGLGKGPVAKPAASPAPTAAPRPARRP